MYPKQEWRLSQGYSTLKWWGLICNFKSPRQKNGLEEIGVVQGDEHEDHYQGLWCDPNEGWQGRREMGSSD